MNSPTASGATTLLVLLLCAPACVDDNAAYCADDADCRGRATTDPSVGPVCHPLGHFCHEGCANDADCRDPAADGYHPGRPNCDTTRRHCVVLAPPSDGGGGDAGDGGTDDSGDGRKNNGAGCDTDGECKSLHCSSDGVCCDRACDGTCERCSTGVCRPRAAGSECGEPRCEQGLLTARRCTADGDCTARETSCGGYTCAADGGAACRTACDPAGGCLVGFECIDLQCNATLPDGDACGDNDLACASKQCVDGVCCAEASCADCFRCDRPGAAGSCQPRAAGTAPAGECPGDSPACGAGSCDGAKGCAYAAAGTAGCGQPSCSGATGPQELLTHRCDGVGNCAAQSPISCGFARCVAGACLDGCADGQACIVDSLCDRAMAHGHPAGHGACVDPADVVTPGPIETLGEAVARAVAAGKHFLRLAPGSYTGSVTVVGAAVTLIGTGTSADAVVLEPASSGLPALRVEGLGTLGVQGIKVQGATSGAPGVQCSGGAKLTVVESVVITNAGAGVDASSCVVTLRRNRIRLNQGGGAQLEGGSAVVVNNLVTNNGVFGLSPFGGLWLAPASGQLTCSANTVAANSAQDEVAAGVVCSGSGLTLHGAIVWDNGLPAHDGCTFAHANVEGGAPAGTGNISVDPGFVDTKAIDYSLGAGSLSIDAGDDLAPGLGSIDLERGPRKRGAAVDQGAIERP